MDLLQLAERCEQATGPDSGLDNAIQLATNNGCAFGDDPAFTASLDAAMTLVPEGSRWSLNAEFSDGPDTPLEYWTDCSPAYGKQREKGYGATPALALCAAALRARASQEEGRS